MKRILPIYITALLVCCAVGASITPSLASDHQQDQEQFEYSSAMAPYTGRLRVYIAEPVSRWNMYNGAPYHFGFLGFAVNEDISVTDSYQKSVTWNGDVSESNVMVMAVVFNSEPHQGYAYPPSGNPFTAYYTDATAAATPGTTGYNVVADGFSHTVFAEEGTATWCPYCPAMANALNSIYESGDYPFYFVALVADMNGQAASRLSEFNLYGYPTAFFDGGYQVYVGGNANENVYRTRIVNSGARDVPALNLSLSVEYIGSGDLQIDVDIINLGSNSPPATPSAPSGETSGSVGTEYDYTASTTDPESDNVWYWFDWDDGTNSGWVGPYTSGETGEASHSWSVAGTYNVKVKAKDTSDDESGWSSTLPVTITAPAMEIGIAGGLLKVSATLTNIGGTELTDVSWTISVTGGLLGMINVQSNGTIPTLAVSGEELVNTGIVFGLGSVSVTVTADAESKTATGFVFGPFISIS
jgi:thiol-disulfide isomerase/thioredoxin